ncbi:hypothetical protein ACN2XU_21415 [Primorskyibacter sp. 2E107]|uniref:hypothetical protein n=1 Tax=Primorskyibacter sp. 2E107 TaxID=3403458 RepID=UPI003AF68C00
MTLFPEWQAFDIAQDLLDKTGKGYSENRFDLYERCFVLPHEFETFQETRRISDVNELRKLFDNVRNFFSMHGITELHRRVVAAKYLSEDTIRATHESRLIGLGSQLHAPYPAMVTLKRFGFDWKIAKSAYAFANNPAQQQAIGVGTIVKRQE